MTTSCRPGPRRARPSGQPVDGRAASRGPPPRYRMLETLRQYAVEQARRLRRARRRRGTARRLLPARSPSPPEQGLRGSGQREALRRLRDEHPNLRAALAWLSADAEPCRGRPTAGRFARPVLAPGPARRGSRGAGEAHRRARRSRAGTGSRRCRRCRSSSVPAPAWCTRALGARRPRARAWSCSTPRATPTGRRCRRSCWPSSCSTARDPDRFAQLLAEAEEQFTVEDDEWGHAVIAFVRLQNFIRRGDEAALAGDGPNRRRRRSGGSTTPGVCPRCCTTSAGG